MMSRQSWRFFCSMLAFALWVAACQQSSEPSDTASGRGEKPSDDGEGVPGFLIPPEKIDVAFGSGNRVTIRAGADAVPRRSVQSTSLVYVWQVKEDNDTKISAENIEDLADRIGQTPFNVDGSFEISLEAPNRNPIYCTYVL